MSDPNAAPSSPGPAAEPAHRDFIREIVAGDVVSGKHSKIITRFPPEPNGYLHIGHAKSICLNFGIARDFEGRCNLRMDDTNPTKEDVEYVESIMADVRWLIQGWADDRLGFKSRGATPSAVLVNGNPDFIQEAAQGSPSSLEPFFASDYFDQLYTYAVRLIQKGLAYICDLSPEDTDAYRGSPDRPGKDSPFRNRTVAENLDLFARMREGEFPNGARTLRAKIDMASPNIWMRDPVLYRIRHATHHHTGDKWRIYPMYDFAHCLSDYLEGVTHSICTLEFEVHRPLYDWILENLNLPRPLPHQFEFARLSLTYTVMSKRKLLQLVNEKLVTGWDDPRLPTLSGIRRRGGARRRRSASFRAVDRGHQVRRTSLRSAVLEHCIRGDLNPIAHRRLGVSAHPLKVVLTNLPEGHSEAFVRATNNPEDENGGDAIRCRSAREVFIEQRGLHGDPAEGLLPAAAGRGGAVEVRRDHPVHRRW
jgi:glutaminyl-tRNA synthetase